MSELVKIHGILVIDLAPYSSCSSAGSPVAPPRKKDTTKSKENLYEKLPDSLKTEVLVRSKVVEDDDVLRDRQELTRSRTPRQLGEIHGLSDFPIPTLRKKKIEPAKDEGDEEGTKEKESLYDKLPASLKTEVLVRSKVEEDAETLKQRQELTRAMSPARLAEIRGLSDLPFPSLKKRHKSGERAKSPESNKSENVYDRIPSSLKTEMLVRSKIEDQEVLKQRQEMTRSMSPHQLAEIRGLSDLPFPSLRKRHKSGEKLKSRESSKSKENISDKIPDSLKVQCLVRTKIEEDEEVLKQRQELTRAMSPAELSKIHGLSDFPIPSLRKKKKKDEEEDLDETTKSKENLYERLPSSLKQECLVRTKVESDEKVLKERQELTRAMSPAELGRIHGFSDFPIPSFGKKKKEDEKEVGDDKESTTKSKENLYERLPQSLKQECLVRTKVEADEKVLQQRQEMTRAMSPAELSRIHGFSDFPVPSFFKKKPEDETKVEEDNEEKKKENLYERLPDSWKTEVLVRSKVEEDEKVLKERQELARSKSPAELGRIRGLSDIPFPSFRKKQEPERKR